MSRICGKTHRIAYVNSGPRTARNTELYMLNNSGVVKNGKEHKIAEHSMFLMPFVNALTVPTSVNPMGFEPSNLLFCFKTVKFEYFELINATGHSLSILQRC